MLLGFFSTAQINRVTAHQEKIWKSQGIPEWSGNVRGNCFRPTPLGEIGGTNFFLLASLAYYLYSRTFELVAPSLVEIK